VNRYQLADSIVSGVQRMTERLLGAASSINNDDFVSPCMANYRDPGYCRLVAMRVRSIVNDLGLISAQLSEHAGMLEAFSHLPQEPFVPDEAAP